MFDWDRHVLFRSSDEEETEEKTSLVLGHANVAVTGAKQKLEARVDYVPLGPFALVRMGHNADVRLDRGLGKFCLISIPCSGRASFRVGASTVEVSTRRGAVVCPTVEFGCHASQSFRQLLVRLEPERVDRACASALGHPLKRPIEFAPSLELRGGTGQQWRLLVAFLTQSETFVENAQRHPLIAAQLEQMIISILLCTHMHTYFEEQSSPARPAAPCYVMRAEEYMRTHPEEAITVCRLATIAGISERSLLEGFRRHRGTSPMAMLRDLRLTLVHKMLSKPEDAATTVTETALAWGFTHLGSFSDAYRRKFGEVPSATLEAGKRATAFDRLN